MTLLPCCPGGFLRFSLSRVQCEMHLSPLRKSFSPSLRHCRQRGSELFAIFSLKCSFWQLASKRSRTLSGLGVYTPNSIGASSSLASFLAPRVHGIGYRLQGVQATPSLQP